MQNSTAWGIGALQVNAAKRLETISDTPALDTALLLAFVLGKPRSYLFGHPERTLTTSESAHFQKLMGRRMCGEPIAYLVGQKGFWTLDLAVSNAVLVPRPETELLVEATLARLPASKPATIADLGTGSGAIALALASERSDCRIIATDFDATTLSTARTNAQHLELPQVEFRAGSWFTPLVGERLDFIVANPPYVAADDPHLADLRFEPQTALVASDNGCDCLRHLVARGPTHLSPGGWLLLEHGTDQAAFVRDLMARAGFVEVATKSDLAGHPRVTLGRRS